jgi:hypothetical protein
MMAFNVRNANCSIRNLLGQRGARNGVGNTSPAT